MKPNLYLKKKTHSDFKKRMVGLSTFEYWSNESADDFSSSEGNDCSIICCSDSKKA